MCERGSIVFKRILVPVDGSSLAERAIPVAARLAHASEGTVILLRVVSRANEIWPHLPADLTDLSEAERYLSSLAVNSELRNVKTDIIAQIGEAAPMILAIAHAHNADVIVLSSHGYTGVTRWMLGSVALKVSKHSPLPVLVLRGSGFGTAMLRARSDQPLRALVALDGSSFAEATLTPTAQLLAALRMPPVEAELHLVQVVKLPTEEEIRKFHHLYDVNVRDLNIGEAEKYLRTIAKHLSSGVAAQLELRVSTSVVEDKDIAEALIQVATPEDPLKRYDLLAIATHGRSGFQRWVLGSIAERVLEGTKLPLFIVRPQKAVASISPVKDA